MKSLTYKTISILLIGCLLMAFIDGVISPNYFIKSALKLLIFLVFPLMYTLTQDGINYKKFLSFNRRLLLPLLLGVGVYVFILGAYFILGPYFDFSAVTHNLESNIGVNKGNFLYVALYIACINSLIEEFFFRGLGFLLLKEQSSRVFAYGFSSICFALYHVAMMKNWFSPLLFILLIGSLVLAGLFFDWLDEKTNTLYTSWFVHLFANLAINTIGCLLFGIF